MIIIICGCSAAPLSFGGGCCAKKVHTMSILATSGYSGADGFCSQPKKIHEVDLADDAQYYLFSTHLLLKKTMKQADGAQRSYKFTGSPSMLLCTRI